MGIHTKAKKKIWIKDGILILFSIILVGMALKGFAKDIINSVFPPNVPQSINMTKEEKIEDFEYLYSTLVDSIPMIDCYKELYGIDFKENKEKYKAIIEETDSDLEFYTELSAIVADIPSFHTDVVDVRNIKSPYCYNSKKVTRDREVLANSAYFVNEINMKITEYPNIQYTVFKYVDGEYYFDDLCCNDNSFTQYTKIKAIDGMNVDDYILAVPSTYCLHYDGGNNKAMRTRIIFNDSIGKEVKVDYVKEDGTEEVKKLYISTIADWMWLYSDMIPTEEYDHLVYYDDDDNHVSYIQINSMGGSDGEELRDIISNLKYENVIVDLRNNYGGNTRYASEYIYPSLFAEDVHEAGCWYMPATKENRSIINNFYNYILIKPKKNADGPYDLDTECYCSKVSYNYEGKATHNKTVTILVGIGTGSAADRFVSDMKKNNLVTVVGNNTGGEGLAYSYNMISLPNSKLAVVYMPGGAKNPDGTDNSVYGTVPDYYINQSIDDYYKMQVAIENGETGYSMYMKYDSVLKFVVEKMDSEK